MPVSTNRPFSEGILAGSPTRLTGAWYQAKHCPHEQVEYSQETHIGFDIQGTH